MTSRERMEHAEEELRRAIAASKDATTINRWISTLVTAALVAGVEAERNRQIQDSQKSESEPQNSIAKRFSDLAN